MKLAVVALGFAALAHAQTRADVPSCALPCLDDAVKQKTSCATDDYACICKDQSTVKSAATSCVLSKCGTSTALSTIVLIYIRVHKLTNDIDDVLPAVKKICDAQ
jgi:hypothetical protein